MSVGVWVCTFKEFVNNFSAHMHVIMSYYSKIIIVVLV